MNARGVSVGAHTVSHPILSRVSPEQARREIAESKRTIEGELGCPVRNFAYPNGARVDFDDTTKTILSECGFDCALTTIFGTNDDDSTDRPDMLELKRMDLVDGRLPLFATKLNVYRW